MSMQYSRNEAGGVGVIPPRHHHAQRSIGGGGGDGGSGAADRVCSPVSPLDQSMGGGGRGGGSWSSQSSGSSSSPPTAVSSAASKPLKQEELDFYANPSQRQQDYNSSSSSIQHALREIESRLLLDDDDELDYKSSPDSSTTSTFMLDLLGGGGGGAVLAPSISRDLVERMGDPRQLLLLCAESIANGDFALAEVVISRLNQVVCIYGQPMERLAAYMVEGLVARIQSSGTGLCRALRCKEPVGNEILSAMQVMYEVCPYIKFGYMAANGAIAEALKDEPRVHIIDFEIAQGTQYIALIQALARRPGGPPTVRITGVGDPAAGVAAPGGVAAVGRRLAALAADHGVPFEFHAVPVSGAGVTDAAALQRRPGEALAVNFAMQLHHMPDESVSVSNPRDRLLRMAKSLGPKIVTLVEQEANTNTAPFLARFKESLSYYGAVFESLDVTLPRQSKERISVEQHCLARDLVNLIACEGAERIERHEVMGKWRARMSMAGFKQYPLSRYVNQTISCLLKTYCDKYKLSEEDGVIYLGWLDRSLVSASAWN
ncbi:scarecrow-like protein 21 [Selaginella moellendorffii]|nr:scarecrow-like protein 21 [Selaginella moellendorffii]|eukprot:XP_002971092.2 scarecrow-like protein 21 [Selaginella moellendorffii]